MRKDTFLAVLFTSAKQSINSGKGHFPHYLKSEMRNNRMFFTKIDGFFKFRFILWI